MRWGFSYEEAKDIAHDLILKWLERGHTGQTVQHGTIDVIKKRYGRKGHPRAVFSRHAYLNYVEFGERKHGGTMEIEDCKKDILKFLESIESPTNREIIHYFLKGYNLEEIGAHVALSDSRVSQRLKEMIGHSINRNQLSVAQCLAEKTKVFEPKKRKASKGKIKARQTLEAQLPILEEWKHVDLWRDLTNFEVERIMKALKASDGNIAFAARLLKVRRTTLVEKMRKYSLTARQYSGEFAEVA